jgi:RNA polymerase sigma-70 factor (ECF subfamily)
LLRRCIARLPEQYRTVLLLRDIEERSTQEAADLLDMTPTAVKVRLHRARQALSTLFRREYQAQPATV